jgi:hypothetical protein
MTTGPRPLRASGQRRRGRSLVRTKRKRYQVARTGDRTVASITVFHERDQAERSNELAAEWVAESLADFDVERMAS